MKKTFTATVLVVATVAVSFVIIWGNLSSDPKVSRTGIEEASYVGLSTELMIPSRGSDRNNIFWSSKIGSGGVALSTAPIIFPSFVRLGSGFAVPGAESIIFVDSDLRAKKRFTASNLRPEVQATSASSANHRHGAFVFNIANNAWPDARQVVGVSADGIKVIDRRNFVSGLTACDDGTIKWIEFSPVDRTTLQTDGQKAYSADLVTWSVAGDVQASKIRWEFSKEIGHEN